MNARNLILGTIRGLIACLAMAWLFVAPAHAEGPDFLVDTMWVEEHIDDPKVVVLEVRYFPHRYYTVGPQYPT